MALKNIIPNLPSESTMFALRLRAARNAWLSSPSLAPMTKYRHFCDVCNTQKAEVEYKAYKSICPDCKGRDAAFV